MLTLHPSTQHQHCNQRENAHYQVQAYPLRENYVLQYKDAIRRYKWTSASSGEAAGSQSARCFVRRSVIASHNTSSFSFPEDPMFPFTSRMGSSGMNCISMRTNKDMKARRGGLSENWETEMARNAVCSRPCEACMFFCGHTGWEFLLAPQFQLTLKKSTPKVSRLGPAVSIHLTAFYHPGNLRKVRSSGFKCPLS